MRYLAVLLSLTVSLAVQAETKTFQTVPNDQKNVVQFVSQAPIEKIVGTTSAISGSIDLNLDDVLATNRASFEVEMATLKTGISMRDGHMRDNHLHTDKYPKATFTLAKFISSNMNSLTPGTTAKVVAEGELDLHGMKKTYQIPLTIFYDLSNAETTKRLHGSTGNILSVSGEWTVKLADHQIPRPELLMLRLSEDQQVSVNIALTDVLP